MERADFPEFWQSVTGSQEDGESWAETAKRELMEETGFDAALYGGVIDLHYRNVYCIYPRWRHRYPPQQTHNEERCFAVCIPSAIKPSRRENMSRLNGCQLRPQPAKRRHGVMLRRCAICKLRLRWPLAAILDILSGNSFFAVETAALWPTSLFIKTRLKHLYRSSP